MIDLSDITQILSYADLVVFVATAVWAVSKIRNTTQILSHSLSNLEKAVTKVDHQIEGISDELRHMRDRVVRLEAKLDLD